ncbi:protein NRT1/ PTR FAMILY 5.3-like [Cryptomeria japonica]|uniref:protein NRT1/ PTR FAMILY 5.3-like n=1 Tax=Cryptomeria japonica TaxID=3369 RepID=UPI0027DA4153|nr:protein NRT1/ PTR FAMILY 5.3-like [Cryptomeria japonica]
MDKAAVQNTSGSNPCTVTDVEETKIMIRILPIWLTLIFPSTLLSQGGTLFIKQGMSLNRHMGSNFQIPPASLAVFLPVLMLLVLIIYDRLLVPVCRRFTGNPRGITILQRMGVGMVLYTIAMVAAVITEMKRLDVVKSHGLAGDANAIVPRSMFILLPQYGVMGIAEAFLEVGKLEFFYDQAPESMQSLGTSLYAASLGVGAFSTVLYSPL